MTPVVQERLREAAADAIREAVRSANGDSDASEKTANDASEDAPAEAERSVETGFVFADPREYGCLTDRMTSVRTTRGAGLKFTDGQLGKSRVVIVESGIGADRAADAAKALIQAFCPKRVISAGFAGGLVPSLERNRIILPRLVIARATGATLDLWSQRLDGPEEARSTGTASEAAADPLDRKYATGTLLTSDEPVATPAEKKRLAERFGASLVDMETFTVASVCQTQGVPFLSVRVLLDPVNETLPGDLKNLADASRQNVARTLGAFFGAVSRRPSSLLDMYQLKENALVAADRLADALVEILTLE